MAMSMKSLLTQSDEEDETSLVAVKQDNHLTKSLTGSLEQELPKLKSSHDVRGTINEDANTKETNIKQEDHKRSWHKVADSFNKTFSSRKNTSSSVDASLNESCDNEYFHSEPLKKTSSELNLKSSSINNSDLKDGGSKRLWFKDQLSSYISKSKHYYHNRGSLSASTSEFSINEISNTSDEIESSLSDKVSTQPLIKETLCDKSVSTSLSSDESHLPLMQETPPIPVNPNKISPEPLKKDSNSSKKSSNKRFPTKLSLSELLQSQKSTSASSTADDASGADEESLKVQAPCSQTKTSPGRNEDELASQHELEVLTDVIIKEDLKDHFKPTQDFPITFYHLWLSSLVMFYYFLFDLPAYMSGMITGGLIVFLLGSSLIWFFAPSGNVYNQYRDDLKKFLLDKNIEKNQNEVFKNIPAPETLQKPRRLKQWMSLSYEYNGTFEKELTKEIYAVINSETLHLFVCKTRNEENIPNMTKKQLKKESKKAALDRMEKEKALFDFEFQIEIDLRKCSFYLKPDDLPIRRIWNKKYPMKIYIPKEYFKKSKIDFSLGELQSNLNDILDGIHNIDRQCEVAVDDDQELYLFANTGREKEDWFYRIQLCIQPLKHQISFSDVRCQRLSKLPHESYPHYMVELMTESEKVIQRQIKGKKVQPHLAWLNIFLGRAFWDFWHDKYWTDKLHQKIQSRLSKINTPPFITDITLKDLNCGHNIPLIHKGSVPTLDEYGVWTDLQITYKGYFTLTLETQLNVDYYVNLVTSIAKQKDPKHHAQLSKLTKFSGLSEAEDPVSSLNTSGESNLDSSSLNDSQETYDEQMYDEFQEVLLNDGIDQTDGMEDPINPMLSDPRTKAFLESNTGKKVVGLVGWIAKSKFAKRVAETEFAKKAYEKAYEKFRNMPIILKVEVQSVKGNLAVNIPPPPTNRLWFGFRGNPVIFITASPKVGDKQVRLTSLTNWIERKLKEEFKKYLVLPNMQDLSLKLMDSQLKGLNPDRPMS